MKPTRAQRATRARAITLNTRTADLVVPAKVGRWIDRGDYAKARAYLTRARKAWGDDPEITRAETLISFLQPDSHPTLGKLPA